MNRQVSEPKRGLSRKRILTTVVVVSLVVLVGVLSKKHDVVGKKEHISSDSGAADEYPQTDITGGYVVSPHSIPFIASIQTSGSHFCAGSILSTRSVLTAAQCCQGRRASEIRVVAGEHRVSASDATNEQIKSVSSMAIHESYNGGTLRNDICVLTLSSDLSFTSAVQPATLSSQGQAPPATGTSVTTAGWGNSAFGTQLSDVLQAVELKVQSDSSCQSAWGTQQFQANMICTTDAGKGICLGDAGGPLFTADKTVIGVSSYVSGVGGCGNGKYGSVFAEVSYFGNWINSKKTGSSTAFLVGEPQFQPWPAIMRTGFGDRTVTKSLVFSKTMGCAAPRVMTFFRVFDMANGPSFRLRVGENRTSASSFNQQIKTWWDSALYKAALGFFSTCAPSNQAVIASVQTSGAQTSANPQTVNKDMVLACGGLTPKLFYGINYLDVTDTAKINIRVDSSASLTRISGDKYRAAVTFRTWSNSKIVGTGAALLGYCPTGIIATGTASFVGGTSHSMWTGHGDRSVTKSVSFDAPLPCANPVTSVALTKFEFGAGKNFRLDLTTTKVSATGLTVKFFVWWDTRLASVSANYIAVCA